MCWISGLWLGFHPRMVCDLFVSLGMGGVGFIQCIYQLENWLEMHLRTKRKNMEEFFPANCSVHAWHWKSFSNGVNLIFEKLSFNLEFIFEFNLWRGLWNIHRTTKYSMRSKVFLWWRRACWENLVEVPQESIFKNPSPGKSAPGEVSQELFLTRDREQGPGCCGTQRSPELCVFTWTLPKVLRNCSPSQIWFPLHLDFADVLKESFPLLKFDFPPFNQDWLNLTEPLRVANTSRIIKSKLCPIPAVPHSHCAQLPFPGLQEDLWKSQDL